MKTILQEEMMEKILCSFFVILKLILLIHTWNVFVGFDRQEHLNMIFLTGFTKIDTQIFSSFYSYHPPLAFLLPRTLFLMGFPSVVSVQLVSAICMLVSFFFVRDTLRSLHILTRPKSIAFLYITYGIPLNVYLSYSINMEAVLFAWVSMALYASVKMYQAQDQGKRVPMILWMLAVTFSLAAGLLTKFTALVFLCVPFLVFLFFVPHLTLKKLLLPVCAVLFAISLAFPYYEFRYHKTEGTWFPTNTNHFDADAQKTAREERDADTIGFFQTFLTPNPTLKEEKGWQYRDIGYLRLEDTWKDFWIMDQWLIERYSPGKPPSIALGIGTMYIYTMAMLLIGGLVLLLIRKPLEDAWDHWGYVALSFSAVLCLALLAYIYQNPWAGSLSNKALYIAPTTWGLGYIYAEYARYFQKKDSMKMIFLGVLVLFLGVNYVVPVY
jgi:hypothetical protein